MKTNIISKRSVSAIAIFLATTAITLAAYTGNVFDIWQEKILDRFFVKGNTPEDILIIAIDNESINRLGQWPWPREFFARAINNLKAAEKIGIDVSFSELSRLGEVDDASLERALKESSAFIVLPIQIEYPSNILLSPLPRFEGVASVGITNVPTDSDSIVRRLKTKRGDLFAFGRILTGEGEKEPPEEIRVDFQGPEKTFFTIPFVDLIESKIPERFIAGKTVLIGATAPDLHDTVLTPYGLMSGVEVHGNIIQTLKSGVYKKDIGQIEGILLIAALNALSVALVFRIRKFLLLSVLLSSIFLLTYIAAAFLFGLSIIIPVLYLSIGFTLSAVGALSFGYISESREKKFIRKSFQYYLSEEVVEQIVQNPEKLKLGGELKKVTIFFSDIRGFTAISETLSPKELTEKLNVYLTAMTDIITGQRGLVDKYIGDAVMAFWGAPLDNDMQGEHAALAALEQMRTLEKLNKKWQAEGLARFDIGIGLSTGKVVVGNMGSEKRFNYTIIGDEVNFASRLEGLNKTYGTSCIISEATKKEIEKNPTFRIRELDLVTVKGKKEPKLIFELITKEVDQSLEKILSLFSEGRTFYMAGEWSKAIECFESALSAGEDGPSRLFLERTKELSKSHPSNWSGIYEFKTK